MVFVILLMQSIAWAIAGLSAVPFALAGELAMSVLGIGTALFAIATSFVAVSIVWRQRRAWRIALVLEAACAVGFLLQLVVPIGADHGPVSLLTNLVLPVAALVLLSKQGESFS